MRSFPLILLAACSTLGPTPAVSLSGPEEPSAVPEPPPATPPPAPTLLAASPAAVDSPDPREPTTGAPAEGLTALHPGHASVPTLPMPGSGRHLPAPAGGKSLNAAVLATLESYPLGDANPYDWHRGANTDGVSRDLFWGGVPLATAGGDGGVHCSGITFEVYLRALARVIGQDVGPSGQELLAAKEEWYVRTDDESGPAGALVTHGLGEVPADVAALEPGDFIQLWRNSGKGHSAIFLSHRYNADGSIRGLVYWSAQGSSGGIGRRIVSFGDDKDQVDRIYAVRALKPG